MSDVLCVVHTSTIVLCGGEIVESLGVLTVTQNPTSWQSCPIPGRGRGCGMCFIFFRWEPSDWDGEHIGTTSMKYNCSCSDDCFGQKSDGVEKMMMILNPSCDLRDMIPWSWLDLDLVHQLSQIGFFAGGENRDWRKWSRRGFPLIAAPALGLSIQF